MRISNTFSILVVMMLAILTLGSIASAQLLVEDFSYASGTSLNGQGGWTGHSGTGTNPPQITTGGLTYAGYSGSGIGNAVSFTTNGEDDNKLFATYPDGITSGSIYYSVMVKLDSVATTGDYFFHLFKNSSTFSARIFAKRAANGNIRFGIGRSSTAANISYSDSIYTVGTTYLLVVKYTVIPGTTNDTVALWVNPAIGGTEPTPTVLESIADRATIDIDTVYGVAVRQGSAANAPIGTVDGIRMDTAWPLGSGGPLAGTKTIPGTYPTLAAAIADLNTLGVGPGGVTFDVAAGYTETITTTLSLTATGTPASPIVFRKTGTGANPLVTAYSTGTGTPSSVVQDGIWELVGSDYVTIDGIDLTDPNTINPATMEFGYALYKASTTDGCQNDIIRNCTITLSRANNDVGSGPAVDGSRGINVVNALPTAATTALTVTAATGSNSNNKFYHNTIQNSNIGIALIGFADVSPFALADQSNDIGGSSAATGNVIKNYGGAVAAINPAAAVRTLTQYGINVSYNTINNNDGGGVNHPSTLRGIYLNTATSANATVTFNTITVNGGGTTALVDAIENVSGSTAASNTVTISNNTVTNCTYPTATTGAFYGIYNSAAPATLTISNNTISNSSTAATSGSYYAIYNIGSAPTAITINSNSVNGITFSSASSLTFGGIYNSAGTATTALNINSNNIQAITNTLTGTGTSYLIYNGGSSLSETITNNTFTNLALNTTGTVYFVYNSNTTPAGGSKTVNGNSIVTAFTTTGASGTVYFYYNNAGSPSGTTENDNNNNFSNITVAGTTAISGWFNGDGGAPAKTFSGNTFSNITAGTGSMTIANFGYGTANIFNNSINAISSAGAITAIIAGNFSTTQQAVYSNSIYTLASTGASTITAIISGAAAASATTTIYKNDIYDLQANNAAGIVYGLSITAGTTVTAYNNFLDDFRAPSTSNIEAIRGISVTSSTAASAINLYYNSIYLNATSTGTNFGTTGIYHITNALATTASLNMRNNVIVNTSTPAGTGLTVAYRRSSTTLTNYAPTSNDNDFYAGTPSSGNLIFYDGTNSDQTISSYKARVSPADANSFSENPPFINAAAHNLHLNPAVPTQLESGGEPITSPFAITDDYDGDTRNALTPDVGADEFTGIPIDLNPPAITYTPLSNAGVVATRTLATTIGDVSGVQRNAAGEPRVYYKKGAAGTYVSATPTSIVGSTFTFTVTHANVGGVVVGDTIFYYLGAQDSLNNAGTNPSGGSGINPPGNVPPANPAFYRIITIISSFPYVQDFESGAGGWESGIFSGSVNDWVLGTPAKTIINGAHSGTKAWVTAVTGQYQNNENAYVQSPSFDFSGLTGDPLLSFWHIFSTELTWDAGIIEYSTDGGTTFNRLGVLNDPSAQNWYDNSSTNGPIPPPKWSGSSSVFGTGYVNSRRPLTGLAGQSNVILRFRFGSDGSGQDEGWAFDDVSITTPPLKDIQVLSASLSPPSPQVGTPVTVSAVIKNNGIEADPTAVSLTYKANAAPADSTDGTVQVFAPTWSGHEATVTFTTTYTPPTPGSLTMWVRSFYPGDGDTTNNRASATINVLPAGTFLGENFTETTFPPPGWAATTSGATIGWARLAATQNDGSAGFSARVNFWSIPTGTRDTLKTPVMNLSTLRLLASPKALAFDHAYGAYPNAFDSLKIAVSTDGGSTWGNTLFFDGSPNMITNTNTSEFTPSSASDWRHHVIRIPDSLLTANVQLSFIGISQFGNDLWIDNVGIATLADTDYAVVAIAQINGIPTPFHPSLKSAPMDKSTKGVERITEGQPSTRASAISTSVLIENASTTTRGVRTYVTGNAFSEDGGLSPLSINAQAPVSLSSVVTNVGIQSPSYTFNWTLDGVPQPPLSRGPIPFLGTDTVSLTTAAAHRGTLTAIANAAVPNDQNPGNNTLTSYRILSYPDTPVVRIKYDNGSNVPNTFIGFGNGTTPIVAGVRFHTTQNLRIANIDAYYRNETNTDSVTVRIRAAGTDTTAPGPILYTRRFAGLNYISSAGDYFTIPLGSDAPAFAAGSDFWVTIGFPAPITFPMGAQNSPLTTPGHSFYSTNDTAWTPLVITTERAWLLRTVGVPATPVGPVVSTVTRSTRVPNAGDSVLVTATVRDSTGISSTSLLYVINGTAQAPLRMAFVSGTLQNGTYRAAIPGSANTNGARIEYQVEATSASGLITTTTVTANNSYFAGISPLSLTGVRAMNANRQILYTNYYARVTGTINGPNYQTTNIGFFMQDGFGGINLFAFGAIIPFALGDSLVVTGKIAQFRGLTEITPDTAILGSDIVRVATGRPVPIITLTLAAFNANPEQYEGMVVRILNMRRRDATPPWPTVGQSANIIVYQTTPTDTTIMRIDSDTEIPGSPEPTYPVNVTGVISQFTSTATVYNDGYETQPRYLTDFTAGSSALAGTYTIGTGGNFATLSAAIAALTGSGVAGTVTFEFTDASYADTAQIITGYPGQGTASLVTFKPANGITPRIVLSGGSAATAAYGIRMDSVAGIVWDGSNSGGTDRSMTIETDTNTATARTPFFIRKGSRNVILKNLIIKGNRHSTGTIPSVVVIDNTGFASSGGQNNMTVTNCQLMRGNNGIFTNSASGAVRDSNHTFTNNLIGGGSSPVLFDHLAGAGVTMTGNHNVLVDSNDVNGIQVAGTPAGIRINGANSAVTVTRNRIHNLVTLAPAAARPLCFLVGNIIATGPGVRTQAVIANNAVYDIHNFGTGASGRAVDGIIFNPTGGVNSPNGVGSTTEWYYNTWNINMGAGEGAANTAFFFDANFAFSNTDPAQYDSIKLYNNVASLKRADSLDTRMWLIFGEGTPGNNRLHSDNNVYFDYAGIFGQIPSPYPGGTTAAFVTSVGAFRDSTRLDSSSVFGDPQFVSATNPHILTGIQTPVESRGRLIAGITRDFDNDLRFGAPGYPGHGTAPDAGADEGEFLPLGARHDIGVASVSTASADAQIIAGNQGVVQDVNQIQSLGTKSGATAGRGKGVPSAGMSRPAAAFGDDREQPASGNSSVAYVPAAMEAMAPQSASGPIVKDPTLDFTPNTPLNFRALVHNFGNYVEPTYLVGWTIDGALQTPVNQPRALQLGATDTVGLTWATPTVGSHLLRAFTILASDSNHVNDSASFSFTVTPTLQQGDTLYTFIVPNQIILGVAKIPSGKLVFTSGGQSSAVTTDNKWIVTTLSGTILDTTHLQVNNTTGQGFGFRDLAWDGRRLLTSDSPQLRFIDTTTFTEVRAQLTGPGTLQRGLATDGINRIWKSNFTTDPVVLFDTTGATIRSLGIPTVAPYGIAFDKWTTPNKGWLWYSEPSSTGGPVRLSKVDTATGAVVRTYNYPFTGAAVSGGLDIVNDDPAYPGRVVAFLVTQNFPTSMCIVIDLGPDSSAAQPAPGWVTQTSGTGVALNSVKAVNQSTGWIGAAGGRVLRTLNTGNIWTNVGNGRIGTADIYAIDALDANTAFVTTSPAATYIFRTTNGGTSWDTVFTQAGGFIDAIKMFDANNGMALGDPVGGKWTIVKTSNGGATWVRDTTHAPVQAGAEAGSNNGFASVGASNLWFAGNSNSASAPQRIYRSIDGGLTWTSSNLPFPSLASNFTAGIGFTTAQIGVVGNNNGLAVRTTDGGATWISVTIATGSTPIYGVAPAAGEFFATMGANVYRSSDRGATWSSSFTGSIGTFNHASFATNGSNTRGWAVTATGGIAAFSGSVTDVKEGLVVEIPTSFSLLQNYPNPFNPTTTLRYALPKDARVTLSIYNILGQRVATLRDEVENVGFYNIVWNGRNDFGTPIASGVYFYRIEARPTDGSEAFTSIKKMLMLK